jgi:hypothetical protein
VVATVLIIDIVSLTSNRVGVYRNLFPLSNTLNFYGQGRAKDLNDGTPAKVSLDRTSVSDHWPDYQLYGDRMD